MKCAKSIVVLNIVVRIRIGLILTIGMWSVVISRSHFAMILLEHLHRELKSLWKLYGIKHVPLSLKKYIPDPDSDFSDECDFLPSEEGSSSINI